MKKLLILCCVTMFTLTGCDKDYFTKKQKHNNVTNKTDYNNQNQGNHNQGNHNQGNHNQGDSTTIYDHSNNHMGDSTNHTNGGGHTNSSTGGGHHSNRSN